MLRGFPHSSFGWSNNPHAWQWTGLLVLAYAAVAAAALSLRALSDRRNGQGFGFAAAGLAAFAVWTAIVRYAIEISLIMGVIVICTFAATSLVQAAPAPESPAGRRGPARALVIVALTALGLLTLGVIVVAQIPTGG
jgi:hypothetical protein